MGGGAGIGIGAQVVPAPSFGSNYSRHSKGKSVGEEKLLPPVGLKNVGNTCYANAALQCILSTALSHALLDPKSTKVFRRYSSNPGILALGSGSVDSEDHDDTEDDFGGGAFGAGGDDVDVDLDREARRIARQRAREERRKNREKMLKHEKCQWLTGQLTDITRIYTASYLNNNDSKDLWKGLLHLFSVNDNQRIVDPGGVTRHVDKISPCLRPYRQEDAHEFLRSLLSTLTLEGHNKELSSLFDGLLESAVTCQTCHRASITRDRYMDLSLDIQGDIQDLTGALNHFTQTEILDRDNKVFCARCKKKRVVTKGLRLATAPSVLVCHLKRFAFDIYGRTTRLSKHVKYPLRLEIGDFMSRANQSKPPPYELVGVLVHAGKRCESGHYWAFIKSGDSWYKANDEVVTKVSIDVVLRQQAYILFYEVEGMRSRNGYHGFHKYHDPQDNSVDGGSNGRTDPYSTPPPKGSSSSPSKMSDFLDSMLHLCGSVETVRDAICDSERKAKKKKERSDHLKKAEPLPSCSSSQMSHESYASYKKSSTRYGADSIFRRPVNGNVTYEMNVLPERYNNSSKDASMVSKSDHSIISTESHLIRSISSNNIFEKEEEALNSYEMESYDSAMSRPPGSSRDRNGKLTCNRRSMSPMQYRYNVVDDEDRNSDTNVLMRPNLMRRKSNSAPRTRINESYVSLGYASPQQYNALGTKLPPLPRRPQ
eukprot:CAMPEP_0176487768 /NCGR_PEP_ID=MMETSP0200_2-20121128/6325_1 /TAXON_ID=947934 /ORGANISM="Chaetoceros sp., Strain GSL56" /LENGTH=709 /DNA_ID=CAMNT_0017884653 /DNA_START=586 /DNA_END=2715 /DNA_ORIENTATION=-